MEVMILDITQLLDICISDKLIDMVISGQKNKSEDKAVKVRICLLYTSPSPRDTR